MDSDDRQALIIRADANSRMGSGHIMRCFSLAQSWQQKAGAVIFVTNCESPQLIERIRKEKFEVVEIQNSYPHPSDWEETKGVLAEFPNAWCVVDGYEFDSEFYGLIRRNGNRVLVVDDTVRLPFYEADAILNQNIDANQVDYKCPPETVVLLGTKYALLRQEFSIWRDWRREAPEIANKILITMGGSDIQNQTRKAIRAIDTLEESDLDVLVLVGSSYGHLAELEKLVEHSNSNIELIRNADNIAELMSWADMAISAAGSTCWELCFMQVPSVLMITADNQRGIGRGLSEAGFAKNLDWFEEVTHPDLAQALSELLPDKEKRERMGGIGRRIVDGMGRERVIDKMRSK